MTSIVERPAGGQHTHRWALAVFLVLLISYGSTLPTTLTDADAGEFLVIAKMGGVAHPPGYPLFAVLGRALAVFDNWIPLVTVVALSSALFVAAAGAVMVGMLATLIDVRRVACATLLALLTPQVWRQANAPEPFALNLLLSAIVIGCSAQLLRLPLSAPPRRAIRFACGIGLCFGLGVANHHTLALLAPLPLLVAWRWRATSAVFSRAMVLAVVAFAIGATPVLLLLSAKLDAPLVFGDWDAARRWEQLGQHLLRRAYGTFSLAAGQRAYGECLWHFLKGFAIHTLFVGPLLLMLGILRARAWGTVIWTAALAATIVAGPMFLAMMSVSPLDEPVVVARFFALPMLVLIPWLALGVHTVASWVQSSRQGIERVVMFGAVALLVVHGTLARRVSNRAEEHVYEMHIRQQLTLASRPDIQVLVSATDLEDYGLAYGKYVLGLAPRATLLTLSQLNSPWYRARVTAALAVPPAVVDSGAVAVLELLNTRSPLFIADPPQSPRPSMFVRARPLGGLLVVVPPGAALPTWKDLYDANVEAERELPVLPTSMRVAPLSDWERRLLTQHRDLLRELCAAWRADGGGADVADCDARSRTFDDVMTRLGTTHW